ncbi:MAG: hypothetical protein IPK82_12155 [Polyangiaceae bacterium]|nr:hypothetical protein [Polyangiaceae bacterium]
MIGAFASVYIAMLFVFWPAVAAGVFCGLLAAIVAYSFRRRRRLMRGAASSVLNAAFNLIGLGRLREASQVLDVLEQHIAEPWALRLVDIQRAIIAIRMGEMEPALARLTSAIERPTDGYLQENVQYQMEGARALRAFVNASLGKHAEAQFDIDFVKQGNPSDDALARVELAQAMILEQQGKREELRQLLLEKSTLLLEHTHPRERAIVRAFQRLVRSGSSSVYRRAEARPKASERDEPTLADWVARVAPTLADFVRSPRAADQAATVAPGEVLARPTEHALRANAAAKKAGYTFPWKTAGAVAVAVVAGFVALVMGISSAAVQSVGAQVDPSRYEVPQTVAWILGMFALSIPAGFGVMGIRRALMRRSAEKAVRKSNAAATGPRVMTEEHLGRMAQSPSPVVAAQALLMLADRAERASNFEATLEYTTRALGRLQDPKDRTAADIVYPDLLSLRAFALSAVGRFEEANAELSGLGNAYPHFGRAVFRARLMMLARSGAHGTAAQWVAQSEADLPLSVREELLADLICATTEPEKAGAGEVARLRDELRAPELRTWIQKAAPRLLHEFEKATTADVQMRIEPLVPAEHLREAQAEEEAAAYEVPEKAFTPLG